MKKSQYKSYDDLPLFLNAEQVSQVLGMAHSQFIKHLSFCLDFSSNEKLQKALS